MESTTLHTALAIAIAGSLGACNPSPPDQMAKRPASAPAAPASPPGAFQSSVKPGGAAPSAPLAQDNALSEKVKNVLTSTTEIKTGGLQVSAADGVVTLNGTVEADREKQRAALLAMDVDGVRSVVNNLVVLKGSG